MIKDVAARILFLGILLSPHLVLAEEFTYDFSTADWEPLVFKAVGAKSGPPGKQTKEGMLITAPSKTSKKSQVGYATRFAITGDFEITVGYKLLEVPRPEKGYGAGFMFNLFKAQGGRINFSRSLKADGVHKFSTALWTKKKGTWTPNVERIPAEHDYGELKLVRKGSTLTFLTKEGDALEFKEIRQVKFGSEPVSRIEFLGDTGGDEQPLRILLTQLSMSADKMLHSAMPIPVVQTFWTSWTFFSAVGAIIVVILGTLFWYQRR